MSKQESKYFYTASLMDEALLILLERKDYDFITVKELCQKAGVNRSTFYLHYETMDDLLAETIEMISRKFFASFDGVVDKKDVTTNILTSQKYLIPYLNFVKENKRVYKLIHENPNLFGAKKTFQKMYEQVFSNALKNFGVNDQDSKYVFSFYTEGTLAIIKRWIEDDCSDDIEKIADIISKNTFADKK